MQFYILARSTWPVQAGLLVTLLSACGAPASNEQTDLGSNQPGAPTAQPTNSAPTSTAPSTSGGLTGIDLTPTTTTNPDSVNATTGCGDSNVRGTIRDFTDQHPDFENLEQKGRRYFLDLGMVADTLGTDRKPVYLGDADGVPGTASTSGGANFAQWFSTVDGVNQAALLDLPFTPDPATGVSVFDSGVGFFPIDNQFFGNGPFPPGTTVYTHNYHFTFEFHTRFQYNGGENFTFRGDDDVWVFVDNRRVCDLGGVHGPLECAVPLDSLGLVAGQQYPLDFFYAERHIVEANFRISTTLVFTVCDVIQ